MAGLGFCIFWITAAVLTAYYGARSVVIQRSNWSDENIEREKNGYPARRKSWLVFVWCVQDPVYNMVCSAAGFGALHVLLPYAARAADLGQVSTGGGVLLAFLALLAVTGISGKLPELLHLGRFPLAKPA